MATPAYLTAAIASLLKASSLTPSHQERVIAALKSGPRMTLMELAKAKGVHRNTVWLWINKGIIPKPRKDGRRTNTWDYDQIKHVLPQTQEIQ